MFNFFRRNKNKNYKDLKESIISSKELTGEQDTPTSETEIHTELSFHPDWKLQEEDKYVFRFLNTELPPLKPFQLSLSGIDHQIDPSSGKLVVTAFLRNSLMKPFSLNETTLLLLNGEGQQVAKKNFDLSKMGSLQPKKSLPWHFEFEKEVLNPELLPLSEKDWKIAFEIKPKHKLDLPESWEQALPQEQKEKLIELVETKLEAPKEGEVNFMGLQANFQENGSLHITLLIRNGSEKNVNLQQIPLVVEDATNEIIATGGFKLEDFEVKAFTTKPWTFIFPQEMVQKEKPDLSKWKAYVKS